MEGLWGGAGFQAAPATEVTGEVRLPVNLVKLSEPKLRGTTVACYKDSHKRDDTNYAVVVKAFFFFFSSYEGLQTEGGCTTCCLLLGSS